MINNGASHSFVADSVVELHKWFLGSIKLISICLDKGSEVILDLYTILVVFYDVSRHVITQHVTCQIMKELIL